MSASHYVHLDVTRIERLTEKAMLVELEDGDKHWLPLSQVADAETFQQGDEDVTVSISEWLANEKGLS